MACYAYSVLTRWFSSVYSGARSRPSSDQMAKQVVIASSVTPRELNDNSQLPETTCLAVKNIRLKDTIVVTRLSLY